MLGSAYQVVFDLKHSLFKLDPMTKRQAVKSHGQSDRLMV
jgi:hypothetical protein